MDRSELPGLFITGTDTGVGKTFVAAALARTLQDEGRVVAVLKPVATGATRDADGWHCDDGEALRAAVGPSVPLERVTPFVFEEPLAPSVAARRAGRPLSLRQVVAATVEALAWWAEQGAELAIVEGVGGLLCPLAEDATVAELAVALDYPVVIVARRGLGTLNHTLLTVEAARRRGMRIAGVVLNAAGPPANDRAEATSAAELARCLVGVPVLAALDFQRGQLALPPGLDRLDWSGRAARPRGVGEAG